MNSGKQFEPYNSDYENNYRYHGKINYNAVLSTFITQPNTGANFGEDTFPYTCYAYDSVNNKIAHVGAVNWSDDALTIQIAPVSNDGYIKHFVACTSNCPVSDLIGDTDRITNLRFNQNLQRYNPLDIDFEWCRFGLQAGVINTDTLQKSVVNSIDELKALDKNKYVVEYTKCRNFYKDTRTNDWGGFVDYDNALSLVNNCNDTVLYCRGKGKNNVLYGINVVPRFGIGANNKGQPTYADVEYNSADTGIELIGLDWNEYNEIVIPTDNIFNYLDNGGVMQVTSAGADYKNVEYRLTIDQTLKELAYTGLIFCNNDDPHANLYAGYIDPDGLATGELIPYADWEKTDSLNVKNKFMTDFPDLHIKPKPSPDIDVDDIEPVGYGYFSNTTMGSLYALKNKLDLEKITQWLLTQTEKIDIAKNVVSLKEIPFPLSTLGITPIDTNLSIGGTNVTYQGNNVVVGEIVAPVLPTLSVVFADFDIPRLSNTFLDFSPYTKYELLVPFAPSPIVLPDWCVNKNVKAIFLYDIYTTACQYVIECNGERICSVSGNFGIDRPVMAQNVATKDAARLSSQIATASSVLGGVMSGATGNVGGIISGAVGGVSALSQMILSGKQNYMYTVGANGDSSTVGLYHAAHLKITRTLSAEDDNFVHIYGKPLCKVRKLSDLSGYTKCDNVNTTGLTCSETEKQMIKNLLESGVHI